RQINNGLRSHHAIQMFMQKNFGKGREEMSIEHLTSPFFWCRARMTGSVFPDIFVPYLGIRRDICAQQRRALLRIQVNNLHAQRTQPLDSALEGATLSHNQSAETKLPDQAAAIPARC